MNYAYADTHTTQLCDIIDEKRPNLTSPEQPHDSYLSVYNITTYTRALK